MHRRAKSNAQRIRWPGLRPRQNRAGLVHQRTVRFCAAAIESQDKAHAKSLSENRAQCIHGRKSRAQTCAMPVGLDSSSRMSCRTSTFRRDFLTCVSPPTILGSLFALQEHGPNELTGEAISYERHKPLMRIHPFDLAIVIAYLLAVTALGMRFRRTKKDVAKSDRESISLDYFLGGRTAPWWALALSIVATETSTLTIIGTPAIAYAGNLTFIQLVIGYLIGRILIVILLLPGYFRGQFLTAYALIEKRFG